MPDEVARIGALSNGSNGQRSLESASLHFWAAAVSEASRAAIRRRNPERSEGYSSPTRFKRYCDLWKSSACKRVLLFCLIVDSSDFGEGPQKQKCSESSSQATEPAFAGPFLSSREKFPVLEADLRTELQDARVARPGHLAKGAGAERGVQRRIVGVVESIECFHPELR